MVQRVCVTGASGKAGRAVVADLREHGYDVLATDAAVSREDRDDGMLRADLTDYGQAVEALSQAGADAVVHLANIPAPGLSTPAVTFNSNITMNFNVFQAAAALKLDRVVWASSETTLGLPFDTPPRYAPVDEDHYPVPTSTYALSKVASETVAGHIAQWSGLPFIALRFSNIMAPEDYQRFAEFQDDPHARKWNLWGYIDQRDVALSCRLALEADAGTVTGQPGLHHRGRRHGHEPPVGRTPRRGLPRRQADPRRRRVRDPAGHRPRPRGARLRAGALLARPCNCVIM